MCIDYRILNAVNVKNEYSFFKIQKCLDRFDFVIYWIKFDLTIEYHQMKIANVDIFKTAFNIRLKKFEYTVMFLTLTNASAIFQIIIKRILDRFDCVIYWIKFDLTIEYHQMKIANVDIFKTAFNIRLKKFEYTVMFLTLTNDSAIFQIIMKRILRSYLNKFVIVYFDDIVIYFNFIDEHRKHVKLLFTFFPKTSIFCKIYAMYTNQTKFMFCEHIVENNVIKSCQSKTKIIAN